MLLLVLLAIAFPQMSPQGLQGILWTGAGLMMLLWPPVVRLPRVWGWLVAGFLLFSLAGFLPREWFHASSWRGDLEKLGLDTGGSQFVQAGLAVEVVVGFAATSVVALFVLGHRVGSPCHQRLALGFALGVGALTTVALFLHKPAELFGFFPNRNHTATLLVMGTFAGLGSLAHAIRRQDSWKILLSVMPVSVCLYALHAVSESRAGVVLVFAGFVLWTILIGFRHLQGGIHEARRAPRFLRTAPLGRLRSVGPARQSASGRRGIRERRRRPRRLCRGEDAERGVFPERLEQARHPPPGR